MNFRYDSPEALRVRRDFYDRFSTRTQTWNSWLLECVTSVRNAGIILDIGAGYGSVWSHFPARATKIVLTDLSHGMLAGAAPLAGVAAYKAVMNGSQLAIRSDCTDIVTAFNVLYHIADRVPLYSEVRRVLRHRGTFIFSTSGRDHLRELRELVAKHTSVPLVALGFPIQDAVAEVASYFRATRLAIFPDALIIREPEAVLSYVMSTPAGDTLSSHQLDALRRDIHDVFAINPDRTWHVTTEVGVVVCETRDNAHA